jgi:hypothetical protein
MKAGCHVPCKSDHLRQRSKFQSSQKGKKRETPPTFLEDDLNFTDTVLMGLSNNPIVHSMVSIGVEVSTYVSYYLHTIVTPPQNPICMDIMDWTHHAK